MYVLNKIVWFFLNPVSAFLICAATGAALALTRRWRRLGAAVLTVSLATLYFASTPMCVCMIGLPLERPFLSSQTVESLPESDAIVVLGGGFSKCEELTHPDLHDSADRAWHAARIWKSRKAPLIIASGTNELAAAVPLLTDLGVSREAIAVDNESRNTYENSRFTERLLNSRTNTACRVLLVTSAWHMRRAIGNFSKTSLKVTPAPCDFTAHSALYGSRHWWNWISPSADSLTRTSFFAKEWLGRLSRR